jgi:8-oxo-dGTP pyrophosphatase MutT (NUDIX family)
MTTPVDQALAKHRPSRRLPSTIGVEHGANRSRTAKNVPKEKSAVRLQYGALPYRITNAEPLEILLVTTRRTRRWMIPKGWPIKGLKAAKSAAREAYEEAGVRGTIKAKALGMFSYEKRLEEDGIVIPCEVRVFPLLVKRQSKTWPESHQRKCRWFTPERALSVIKEESLRELISSFIETKRQRAKAKARV